MSIHRTVPWNGVMIVLTLILAGGLTGCELVTSVLGGEKEKDPTLTVFPQSVQLGLAGSGAATEKLVNVTAKNKAGGTDTFLVDSSNTGAVAVDSVTSTSFVVRAVGVGSSTVSVQSTSGLIFNMSVSVSASADTVPAIPTGFYASAKTSNSITLSWNSASDAQSWDVQKSDNNGTSWTTVQTAISGPSVTATQLAPATTYLFQVRAKNTKGFSPWSASLPVTTNNATQQTLNGVPTLSAGLIYQSSIQLKWAAVPGASRYQVEWASSLNGPWSLLASDVYSTDFTATSLSSSTTYYFRVAGKNDTITGGYSAVFSATTTAPATGISPPTTAPSVFVDVTGADWAKARWTAVTGATAYTLSYGQVVSGNVSVWNSFLVYGMTEYTVYGLVTNATYAFKVSAGNAAGSGPESIQVVATIVNQTANSAPLAPGNVSVSTVDNVPYLSWNASPNALGYLVYRTDASGTTFNYIGATDQFTFYFQDKEILATNTNYDYYVVAWNDYGTSSASTVVSYWAQAAGSGLTPTSLYSYSSYDTSYIELDWEYVSGADHYGLFYSLDGGATWQSYGSTSLNYMYFYGPDGLGMATDTTYLFKIVAWDDTETLYSESNRFSYTTAPASAGTRPVNVHVQ